MSNKVQNNKKIKIKKPSIKNQYLVHFLTLVIPFYNKPNQFSFIFEFIINARKKQNKVNSKRHIDKSLSFVMAVLFTIGLVFIYSSTIYSTDSTFAVKQLFFGLIGWFLYFMCARQPEDFWIKNNTNIFNFLIILLILTLFFPPINGSTRWIIIGPFTIQPAEFFRIGVMLSLSAALAKYSCKVNNLIQIITSKQIGSVILASGVGLLLILKQPDLDFVTAIIIIAAILLAKWKKSLNKQLWVTIFATVGGITVFMFYAGNLMAYQMDRVYAWIDPWKDKLGTAYQVINSNIAFVQGGIFGQGLLSGTQKAGYLPAPYNDFILAVIGEETGLVGVIALMGIFLFFLYKIYFNALEVRSEFARLFLLITAVYFATLIIVNFGGVTGFIPMTGLVLPFISYGSSAIWANLMLLGICQSLIINSKKTQGDK